MKRFFMIVFFIPFIFTASLPSKAQIIEGVGMAGTQIGVTSLEDAISSWGQPQSCRKVGDTDNCHWEEYTTGNMVYISVDLDGEQKMNRITTALNGWKTAKGIGPGSTYKELQNAYPGQLSNTTCGGIQWPCLSTATGIQTVFFLNVEPVSSSTISTVWVQQE
eukprot:TRINITY_DN6602_c0_g7_i2.p1 TRINITY_DN6602_c0_g7~~TRINITY_DN6602_c0_g7_i2.p1  ORF type:complete len:163 (+),score=23.03 TRINITY_DN6602_c0_g7_i2:53-541(+)